MIRVVQLSLLGSILSNMLLLVLGCAFLSGGLFFIRRNKCLTRIIADGTYGPNFSCCSTLHTHGGAFWEISVVAFKIQQLRHACGLCCIPILSVKKSKKLDCSNHFLFFLFFGTLRRF